MSFLKPSLPEITVEELKTKMDRKDRFILLDVREPHEFDQARIPGARLIPLGTLESCLAQLNKFDEIVIHCRSGGRSARAVHFLCARGFRAFNLAGGIQAWCERIDPSISVD